MEAAVRPGEVWVRLYDAILGLGLSVAVLLAVAPALADDVEKIQVRVTVTDLTDADAGVDPKAEGLLGALRDQNIKYRSARVVREIEADLAAGESESIEIGKGRRAHLQVMQVDDRGALVAVDLDGGVKADVRVDRGGRPFVVDAGKIEDGKRLVQIEAR